MKKIILAWIKKYVFEIQSPSTKLGYSFDFEYDWLIYNRKVKKND